MNADAGASMTDRDREISRWTHDVAHAVLNPLSGLTMLLAVLDTQGLRLDPELHAQLRAAATKLQCAAQLIRLLTDYIDAVVLPLRLEPVDSARLAREISSDVLAAGGSIRFGELPVVRTDRSRLHRLFREVVERESARFAARRVELSITARAEQDEWFFEVSTVEPDGAPSTAGMHLGTSGAERNRQEPVGIEDVHAALVIGIAERLGGRTGSDVLATGRRRTWFTLPAAGTRGNDTVPGTPDPTA